MNQTERNDIIESVIVVVIGIATTIGIATAGFLLYLLAGIIEG